MCNLGGDWFHRLSKCHMSNNRFAAMTLNIVESVNSVIKPFKKCPAYYLFESLRRMLQGRFDKNRNIACGISRG